MKAFIEKVFKSKKLKKEQELKVVDEATEVMVESIIEEVKKDLSKDIVIYPKPKHFPDCNCYKCERWKQNAK